MVYEGTVVGLKKRSAVVMTGDCQFKEIKRTPAMSSGLKVHFTDADLFKPAVKAPLRFTAIAASLLVCFVLAYSLLQEITGKRAFAYISLEVNPALEISLDKEMKVIKATGLNRDGQDIAKGLKIRGQDAGEAVQAVLSACVEIGYINGDHNRVLIATTFPVKNDELQEELDYRIWEAARKGVAASPSEASVYIFNVDPALREQAIKKGVSAARYLLWQDAQSNGLQCDLDGPLSGPGFSRSANRLSLPFAERVVPDNHAAPDPVPSSMHNGRVNQAPSSPGSGEAPGNSGNQFRGEFIPPGTGENTDNGKEKRSGRPGDSGDTTPAGPDKTQITNGGLVTPATDVKDNKPAPDPVVSPGGANNNRPTSSSDAAKSTDKSPSLSEPAGGAIGGGSSSSGGSSSGSGGGSSSGSGGSGW